MTRQAAFVLIASIMLFLATTAQGQDAAVPDSSALKKTKPKTDESNVWIQPNGYFTGQEVQRSYDVMRNRCNIEIKRTPTCRVFTYVNDYVLHEITPIGSDSLSTMMREYLEAYNHPGTYKTLSRREQERSIAALFHTAILHMQSKLIEQNTQEAKELEQALTAGMEELRDTVTRLARFSSEQADSITILRGEVSKLTSRTYTSHSGSASFEGRTGFLYGSSLNIAHFGDAYIPGGAIKAGYTSGRMWYEVGAGWHTGEIRYASVALGPGFAPTHFMRLIARAGLFLHYDGLDIAPKFKVIPSGALEFQVFVFRQSSFFIEAATVGNRRRLDEDYPDILMSFGFKYYHRR